MSFFRKKPMEVSKEYQTSYWDQRLYELLFTAETESAKVMGHYFKCQLTERKTSILPGGREAHHEYQGRIRLHLGEFEHCVILVDLRFAKPNHDFNGPMDNVLLGHASFGWAHDFSSVCCQRPQIFVLVKDTNELSEQVARAYVEAKASGNAGVEVCWSMVVTSIIGSTAKCVFQGSWTPVSI